MDCAADCRIWRANTVCKDPRRERIAICLMRVVVIGCLAIIAVIMAVPQLHLRGNFLGAFLIVLFSFMFVTVSSRLTGEIGSSSTPISGMTVATLLLTCLAFLIVGWTASPYFVTALSIGGIVCIAASNGGTTSQDLKTGFLVGSTPRAQQIAILFGSLASALTLGYVLLFLNDAYTVYVPVPANTELRAPANEIGKTAKVRGLQGASDSKTYHVWQRIDPEGGAAQRYLVNDQGVPVYLVDPGINGTRRVRPDGSAVQKLDAPKATLMSYIIKGILSHKLPWALVLLGAMIAIVLEMSGIPSLAFAVGVYLPLASSTPIFIGGMVRWLVDRYLKVKFRHKNLSEMELTAEGDKSPGVLLASGYIAGGAITGIVIAAKEMVGPLAAIGHRIEQWQTAHNPFLSGPYANCTRLDSVFYNLSSSVSRGARSLARIALEKLSSKIGSATKCASLLKRALAAVFPIRISPLAKFGARVRLCRLLLHRPRQCGDPQFLR